MGKMRYVYWQHEDMWLGYAEEYPDYWTQGETREELEENLKDLLRDLTSRGILKSENRWLKKFSKPCERDEPIQPLSPTLGSE